jgi:hypothetical protein
MYKDREEDSQEEKVFAGREKIRGGTGSRGSEEVKEKGDGAHFWCGLSTTREGRNADFSPREARLGMTRRDMVR